MKRVYLDHNASAPLRPEARALFDEVLGECAGNASSVHAPGRRARARLDEARERVAAALHVMEEEVVFTSGGTESNNLALLGVLLARRGRARDGLVTTAVEHSSVLGPAAALESAGHPVVRVGVDACGRPAASDLMAAARDARVGLVSLMAANNEVGSVGPLADLRAALDELPAGERPLLHTDAVQALGRLPINLEGVALASFSAHKVGGPLGCGVLVKRSGVPLSGLFAGGGQEFDLRPGTENVPAIAAGALAIELAAAEREAFAARSRELAATLWREVRRTLPEAALVGPPIDEERLPNTVNIALPGIDGRVLVTRLDLNGLAVSAGSACASGSLEPSHVLLAMGRSREAARAGLRLSIGRDTTAKDIHTAVETLGKTFAGEHKP